jgi:hypothetical protein
MKERLLDKSKNRYKLIIALLIFLSSVKYLSTHDAKNLQLSGLPDNHY